MKPAFTIDYNYQLKSFFSKARETYELHVLININGGDVQRKNVVNNVDKSSLWAP